MKVQIIMRHPFPVSWLMGSLALAMFSTAARGDSPRERILMDAGWRFHRGELSGCCHRDAENGNPRNGVGRRLEGDAAKMADPKLDASGAPWADVATGVDVFKGRVGFAWFRTLLPDQKKSNRVLRFENVDDNATVYLNGKKVGAHIGWGEEFDVDLCRPGKPTGRTCLPSRSRTRRAKAALSAPSISPANWRMIRRTFRRRPSTAHYDDSSWTAVHLPHDSVIEGPFSPKGDASHALIIPTTGWYRKTFKLPAGSQGKSLWIDFDGVYRDSLVWFERQTPGTARERVHEFSL